MDRTLTDAEREIGVRFEGQLGKVVIYDEDPLDVLSSILAHAPQRIGLYVWQVPRGGDYYAEISAHDGVEELAVGPLALLELLPALRDKLLLREREREETKGQSEQSRSS